MRARGALGGKVVIELEQPSVRQLMHQDRDLLVEREFCEVRGKADVAQRPGETEFVTRVLGVVLLEN